MVSRVCLLGVCKEGIVHSLYLRFEVIHRTVWRYDYLDIHIYKAQLFIGESSYCLRTMNLFSW